MSGPDEDVVAQVMAAAEHVEALDDECRLLLLSAMTGDDEMQSAKPNESPWTCPRAIPTNSTSR